VSVHQIAHEREEPNRERNAEGGDEQEEARMGRVAARAPVSS
jgi:hypothetical protein